MNYKSLTINNILNLSTLELLRPQAGWVFNPIIDTMAFLFCVAIGIYGHAYAISSIAFFKIIFDSGHIFATIPAISNNSRLNFITYKKVFFLALIILITTLTLIVQNSFLFYFILTYIVLYHSYRQILGLYLFTTRGNQQTQKQIWLEKYIILFLYITPVIYRHSASNSQKHFYYFTTDFNLVKISDYFFYSANALLYLLLATWIFVTISLNAFKQTQGKIFFIFTIFVLNYASLMFFKNDTFYSNSIFVQHGLYYYLHVFSYKLRTSSDEALSNKNEFKLKYVFATLIFCIISSALIKLGNEYMPKPISHYKYAILLVPFLCHVCLDSVIWKRKLGTI